MFILGKKSRKSSIHIAGLPIASAETASTRIRFFRLLNSLPQGFTYETITGEFSADILFVQKRADSIAITAATTAREAGIPVIFDIDDDFGVWPGHDQESMLRLADVVTTNEDTRSVYLKAFTDSPIVIIPDGIDYFDRKPRPIPIRKNISVVTFGSDHSMLVSAPYLEEIAKHFPVTYISMNPCEKLSTARFVKWWLGKFVRELKRHDIALLIHQNSSRDRMKSANRLIAAMALGMPCLVSNTPAYARLMSEVGLKELILSNTGAAFGTVSSLIPKNRRRQIQRRIYDHVWGVYHVRRSAEAFADLVSQLVNT